MYNENVSGSHHFISGSLPDLVRISESISAQTDGVVQYESSASGLSSNMHIHLNNTKSQMTLKSCLSESFLDGRVSRLQHCFSTIKLILYCGA